MAKFEHKENTGSVFTNDKKGNDKAPDMKGQLNIDGRLYNVAMWVKEGNKGKYYSMKIEVPQQLKDVTKVEPPSIMNGKGNGDLPF